MRILISHALRNRPLVHLQTHILILTLVRFERQPPHRRRDEPTWQSAHAGDGAQDGGARAQRDGFARQDGRELFRGFAGEV